jgi:hypothetical protein
MTTGYPYMLQGNNLSIMINNRSYTFSSTHLFWNRLVQAIKDGAWETVEGLVNPTRAVVNYGAGNVSIQGSTLYWKNEPLHNSLATRIIRMYDEGFPIEPMILFMENLMSNPSRRAVQELYGFLEKGELPITPDGHFIAYKRVRSSFLDIHSNTVPNKPAYLMTSAELAQYPKTVPGGILVSVENGITTVEMERNRVDDDRDRTCSTGLHFCSQHYLPSFGAGGDNKVVILKINPRDVVSIPSDYNDSKGRACRYQVTGVLGEDQTLEGLVAEDTSAPAPVPVPSSSGVLFPYCGALIPQEYGVNGQPLSMTPDAIRKRRARAAGATW